MKKIFLLIPVLVCIGLMIPKKQAREIGSIVSVLEKNTPATSVIVNSEGLTHSQFAEASPTKTEAIKESLFDLEKQYSELSDAEIKLQIRKIDGNIANQKLIERANNDSLSPEERIQLARSLRSQNMMKLVLIKRKIEKIESDL